MVFLLTLSFLNVGDLELASVGSHARSTVYELCGLG